MLRELALQPLYAKLSIPVDFELILAFHELYSDSRLRATSGITDCKNRTVATFQGKTLNIAIGKR